MSEPVTEAGRWLLDHQGLINIGRWDGSMRGDEIDLRQAALTIEAEAAERALRDARERVAALPTTPSGDDEDEGPDDEWLRRAAVLRALGGTP